MYFHYTLLTLFIIFFKNTTTITLLSQSSIEKCQNTGTSEISCKSKMVLSLTINNAELNTTDSIETILNDIQDSTGKTQNLSSPIKITFKKSPVKVLYPSIYFQDFNYHPIEKQISTDSLKCQDGGKSDNPTCGWSYDDSKNKILYSQGFCCSCSLKSVFNLDKTDVRGLNCKALSFSSSGTKSMAHCLKFDDLWFSAYKIQQYKIEYNIYINIINVTNNETISELILSPSNTIDMNEQKTVKVQIIGDFLPVSNNPVDLSQKYLLVPSRPDRHTIYLKSVRSWMVVDKSYFTLDGSECDKIGVGYFAFQNQNNKCEVQSGSCLNNQIYHLYKGDEERIISGKSPEYLVYYDKKKYSFYASTNSRSLRYILQGNINTFLTLELDTSILKFINNVSTGRIISAFVRDFIAMSDDGYMEINLENTGLLDAKFTIAYECNGDIIPLGADEISLKIDEIFSLNKSIYTTSNTAEKYKCLITLKNSIGEKIDTYICDFSTSDEIKKNNQNGTNIYQNISENVIEGEKVVLTCDEYCPSYFDFLCFLKKRCWSFIGRDVITLLVFIFIFIILFKCGCFGKLIKCCFCGYFTRKNKKIIQKEIELANQ